MIVGFVLRTFGQIMGCFMNCFRVRDETTRPHLISGSNAVSSKTRHDPLVSRNRLGSLLLSDDNGRSPGQDKRVCNLESPNEKDLKDEARFLRSCGTLLETPVEIRKASEKVKDVLHHDGDAENSKFHSWLPSASIKKLHLEEELDQGPISPVKRCEVLQEVCSGEWESTSNSLKGQKLSGKNTSSGYPESSVVESSGTAKKVDYDSPLSVASEHPIDNTQHNKYVRFECEQDMAILTPDGQDRGQSDFQGIHNGSKRSPYPTPLKLTDEMQTPGTVYSANVGNFGNGKNARIRSQYVYHVLNPVQDFSELMVHKEEDFCAEQLDQLRESLEQSEHASPDCTPASYTSNFAMQGERTVGKKVNVEASLSHWVKPLSPQKNDVQNFGTLSSGGSPCKTPGTERPILGIVAAHWKEDELSRVSPKWWDGNGIPNSTNKYKEDQKVSWHATPFEERLEKALSNESLVHQRSRLSTEPVEFFENEESDTAGSRLQTAKHAKSVVSFYCV